MGRVRKRKPFDLLSGMNPGQRKAVKHVSGPMVVLATAGSGKTEVMCRLITNLVRNMRINVKHLLATTFTVKAANEMTERLKKYGCKVSISGDDGSRVSTIHSTALACVYDGSPWCEYEIDTSKGKESMDMALREILGYRVMNWKNADKTQVEGFIAFCKNNLIEPEISDKYTSDKRFSQAYFLYEEERHRRGLLTFDDMVMSAVKWLQMDRFAFDHWSNRYEYVIVDEFQDTNMVQYEFVKILAENAKLFAVVGDDDQSIYEWRAAQPKYIIEFEKLYNAKVVSLDVNYRSRSEIIQIANSVIKHNQIRVAKQAYANRKEGGLNTVLFIDCADMDEEAEVTCSRIKEHKESRCKYGDIAILMRTKAQSRAYEEVFIREQIPHIVVGGVDFYERKEIKDILSYIRVALDKNDTKSAHRAINRPFRYIGVQTLEKIDEIAENKSISFMDVIDNIWKYSFERVSDKQMKNIEEFGTYVEHIREYIKKSLIPPVIISKLLSEIQYEQWLLRDEGSDTAENSRISNIKELVRSSARFDSIQKMIEHIDNMAKEKKKRKRKDKESEHKATPNLVQIMTIHKSKGLEWPIVFLGGASETILPHSRSENVEEERRLFYVACTRARDYLYISAPRMALIGSKPVLLDISRFVYEAGLANKDFQGADEKGDVANNFEKEKRDKC